MKTAVENCIKYPVHALTGLAFSIFVSFNDCTAACQSDMADVDKMVKYISRKDEEEIGIDESEDANSNHKDPSLNDLSV